MQNLVWLLNLFFNFVLCFIQKVVINDKKLTSPHCINLLCHKFNYLSVYPSLLILLAIRVYFLDNLFTSTNSGLDYSQWQYQPNSRVIKTPFQTNQVEISCNSLHGILMGVSILGDRLLLTYRDDLFPKIHLLIFNWAHWSFRLFVFPLIHPQKH